MAELQAKMAIPVGPPPAAKGKAPGKLNMGELKAKMAIPLGPPPTKAAAPAKLDSAEASTPSVYTGQGKADAEKATTSQPGGIPIPEQTVDRSTLPKEEHFSSEEPLVFIKNIADSAPAGLIGSLLADVSDISSFQMDQPFLQALQDEDHKRKAGRNGTVKHELQESLARELIAHQNSKYGPKGVTCARDFQWGESANHMYLSTYCEMIDGNNSRTGSFTALWIIQSENAPGVNEAEIKGEVSMRGWSYEDCTIHMTGSQSFEPTALEGDADEGMSLAKVIVMQIKDWEAEAIDALNAVYGDEMDGTLKSIRRVLPITKQRLKWDLIVQKAMKGRTKK